APGPRIPYLAVPADPLPTTRTVGVAVQADGPLGPSGGSAVGPGPPPAAAAGGAGGIPPPPPPRPQGLPLDPRLSAERQRAGAPGRLKVFSFAPLLAGALGSLGAERVPLEPPGDFADGARLEPGPVGEYVEVVDIAPASGCFYPPVDLNHPHVFAGDGLPVSE